jgi:hypothetical protein
MKEVRQNVSLIHIKIRFRSHVSLLGPWRLALPHARTSFVCRCAVAYGTGRQGRVRHQLCAEDIFTYAMEITTRNVE